jgi:hypothetical protein
MSYQLSAMSWHASALAFKPSSLMSYELQAKSRHASAQAFQQFHLNNWVKHVKL